MIYWLHFSLKSNTYHCNNQYLHHLYPIIFWSLELFKFLLISSIFFSSKMRQCLKVDIRPMIAFHAVLNTFHTDHRRISLWAPGTRDPYITCTQNVLCQKSNVKTWWYHWNCSFYCPSITSGTSILVNLQIFVQ